MVTTYAKPPLSLSDQVALLHSRGMEGDPAEMERVLATVSYYRLSAYWLTSKQKGTETLRSGTRFADVWERYRFDRELRLLLMDAIERIEVAARTQFTYHHAHDHGPFSYATDRTSIPYLNDQEWADLHATLLKERGRSKEAFIQHFAKNYPSNKELPLWMATEILPFGMIVRLIQSSEKDLRAKLASTFGEHSRVVESWLHSMSYVRNLCAHHCRLWNRGLSVSPALPTEWGLPSVMDRKVFGLLAVCAFCLNRVSPGHRWSPRMTALLDAYPSVPPNWMGMPPDWKAIPKLRTIFGLT